MSGHDVASPPSPSLSPEGEENPESARGVTVRLLVLVAVLAALGSWVALGGGPSLAGVRDWVHSLGVWGPPIFALIYALAVAALLPGSVLGASAGALFALPVGATAVLAGATAGAALSFGLARWLGRPAMARFVGSGRLARLDALLARRGFVTVLLLRLAFVPFNTVNYGAGASGVRFRSFVAATAVGIVPGTLFYTGLGGALREGGAAPMWIALTGLLVLSVGGWWALRLIRARTGEADAAAGHQ